MDRTEPNVGGVVPDVVAGQAGKLTTPAACQRDGAQHCQRLVATVECSVEAAVSALPDAVDRTNSFRFTDHFLKPDLNMRVVIHGISMFHVWTVFCSRHLQRFQSQIQYVSTCTGDYYL